MTGKIPIPAKMILKELIEGITKLKADFIIGMYLTGSIPLNDFHSSKSDIDFIILCNELPRNDFRLQLEQLHKRIDRRIKKPNLSGCYITPAGLNVHNSQTAKTLCFNEGQMNESVFDI